MSYKIFFNDGDSLMTLEQLEERKRELELQREIAKLERNQRLTNRVGKLSWILVAPLTVFALYILLVAVVDGKLDSLAVSIVCFIPIAIKLYFKK